MGTASTRWAVTSDSAPPPPATGRVRVAPPLADLFPGGGIEGGSVLAVAGAAGSTTLLVALLSALMAGGAWAAVLGVADLGVEAAAQVGVPLERLVVVPRPAARWSPVAAVLLDAVDVVAVRSPARCPAGEARRLAARARGRGGLLVVCPPAGAARDPGPLWPEAVDLRLEPVASCWHGLGEGTGVLAYRRMRVRVTGRRAAGPGRSVELWLPGPTGGMAPALGEDPLAEGGPAAEGGPVRAVTDRSASVRAVTGRTGTCW